MSTMQTVTDALQLAGIADNALTIMGPTTTIVMALLGGIFAGQLVKFPLSKFVSDEWRTHMTMYSSVATTFFLGHYLSNHLSVPVEVIVAMSQPMIYLGLLKAAERWAPWLANSVLRTVDNGKPPTT